MMEPVASIPFILGMLMSITTTSGFRLVCQLHRLFPIRRLTNQFYVEMMAQILTQPLPDEEVIVRQ